MINSFSTSPQEVKCFYIEHMSSNFRPLTSEYVLTFDKVERKFYITKFVI